MSAFCLAHCGLASRLSRGLTLFRGLFRRFRLQCGHWQIHLGQHLRFFRIALVQAGLNFGEHTGDDGRQRAALRAAHGLALLTLLRKLLQRSEAVRESREGYYHRQGSHQVSALHTASPCTYRRANQRMVRILCDQ